MTSDTMNAIRNRKNNTFAIPAAVPARPVKPKIAARMATMKKPIAQLSIEPPDSWTDHHPVQSPCRDLGKRGLVLRCRRFRYNGGRELVRRDHAIVLAVFIGQRDRGLRIRRHEAEDAQVILRQRLQRPEPGEELEEMRHPVGMRARRRRIENASRLHARYAVRNQREGTSDDRSVHFFCPPCKSSVASMLPAA